jgi:hypothetical protein
MMREEAYREYDDGWKAMLKSAKAFAASNGSNLARTLHFLETPSQCDHNKALLDRFGFRLCGKLVKGVLDYHFEAALFGMSVQTELFRSVDPSTSNIVELGSGFGKNLFRLWLNGAPAKANYFGYEYTEGGRECATYLASLQPEIAFHSVPFDFYKPELRGLDKTKSTFVFTSYSIEQIPKIGTGVFETLLGIPGLYKVIHVEPVGWQRKTGYVPFTSEWALQRATERSARALHYNSNLLDVLTRLEADRAIVIERPIKYDFVAHRPDLPGTVISWRPAGKLSPSSGG